MCEKDERIKELELEIERVKEESHEREARLFNTLSEAYKFNAEQRNNDSLIFWRPWQVALVPIVIALMGGLGSIAIALMQ